MNTTPTTGPRPRKQPRMVPLWGVVAFAVLWSTVNTTLNVMVRRDAKDRCTSETFDAWQRGLADGREAEKSRQAEQNAPHFQCAIHDGKSVTCTVSAPQPTSRIRHHWCTLNGENPATCTVKVGSCERGCMAMRDERGQWAEPMRVDFGVNEVRVMSDKGDIGGVVVECDDLVECDAR